MFPEGSFSKTPGIIRIRVRIRLLAVLFADLRNFTPMVGTTPLKEVVKIINSYFREMGEAIKHHHEVVIQYIGDEIVTVCGVPVYHRDHPVLAVKAALDMKERP